MRLLADSNVVSSAVRALRAAGHDVSYAAERGHDPGDAALLAEAVDEARVFLTKDRDIGTLIYRDAHPHSGVLLVDDLGDPVAETNLILAVLGTEGKRLMGGAFVRVGSAGVRETRPGG